MTDWIRDDRTRKQIGVLSVTYVRPSHGTEGAHDVEGFASGLALRVKPDGRHSGKNRSTTISEACRDIAQFGSPSSIDPWTYLVGVLTREGLLFEEVDLRVVTVDEWLGDWFSLGGSRQPRHEASSLIEDLAVDGWEIVRK